MSFNGGAFRQAPRIPSTKATSVSTAICEATVSWKEEVVVFIKALTSGGIGPSGLSRAFN